MGKLMPSALILLSALVHFSSPCSEQQEQISTFIVSVIDQLSQIESENISRSGEKEFTKWQPLDCFDLHERGYNKSGVYTIYPINRLSLTNRLDVYCDMAEGGWTVIQKRGDYGRANDFFNQNWSVYKKGFGSLEKDFWLGNDNIFALTNQRLYSVRFALEDKQGNKAYADYDNFWIDDEFNKYLLHISGYSGTAGDSMTLHNNKQFSTTDQDNTPGTKCASQYKSGWWFKHCYDANLNGLYKSETYGINWFHWKNSLEHLPRVEIKIKPSAF